MKQAYDVHIIGTEKAEESLPFEIANKEMMIAVAERRIAICRIINQQYLFAGRFNTLHFREIL